MSEKRQILQCKNHSAILFSTFWDPISQKDIGWHYILLLVFLCLLFFDNMKACYVLRKRVIIRKNTKTYLILVFQAKIGFFSSRFTDSVMFLLFQPLPKQKVPKSKQTLQGQPKVVFPKCSLSLYFPNVLGKMGLKNWVLMSALEN